MVLPKEIDFLSTQSLFAMDWSSCAPRYTSSKRTPPEPEFQYNYTTLYITWTPRQRLGTELHFVSLKNRFFGCIMLPQNILECDVNLLFGNIHVRRVSSHPPPPPQSVGPSIAPHIFAQYILWEYFQPLKEYNLFNMKTIIIIIMEIILILCALHEQYSGIFTFNSWTTSTPPSTPIQWRRHHCWLLCSAPALHAKNNSLFESRGGKGESDKGPSTIHVHMHIQCSIFRQPSIQPRPRYLQRSFIRASPKLSLLDANRIMLIESSTAVTNSPQSS